MSIDRNDSKTVWRSLKDMYEHYLDLTSAGNGQSAADAIRSYSDTKRFHRSTYPIAQTLWPNHSRNQVPLQEQIKAIDEKIDKIRDDVQRRMIADASSGTWVAMGRRNPHSNHEVIHPRTWPFLQLDAERGRATSEDLSYQDLRCAVTSELKNDSPVLDSLRARQRPDIAPEKRGPGRPSEMDFVEDLFARRCEARSVESSLRRESTVLAARFNAAHPDKLPIAVHTIENNLREKFKATKAKASKDRPKL
jgi:hypothetical protein